MKNNDPSLDKVYRNEWKYYCTDRQLDILERRIECILSLDAHAGEDGLYLINSLYFDDVKDTCAHENEAGDAVRFKYRIRSYGLVPGDTFKLERKEKLYGRCHKTSCRINREQVQKLSKGEAAEVFWESDNPLLKKFCVDIMRKDFRPKVIIRYERKAFVEEHTHIRITFDKNIMASPRTELFLEGGSDWYPVTSGEQILEVKFDQILPGYMKKCLALNRFAQTSFSKYYLGRKVTEGVIR